MDEGNGDAAWRAALVEATSSLAPEDALSVLVEEAPDAMTLCRAERDGDGVVVDVRPLYMNRAARAEQPDPAAAIGRLASELWPGMADNGTAEACVRAMDTGIPQRGEFEWTDATTYRPGAYDYHAVRLGDDLLLWALRDIGPRVAAERREAAQRRELEQALAAEQEVRDHLSGQRATLYEDVVQSLTAAMLAIDLGDPDVPAEALARAMAAAKRLSDPAPVPAAAPPGEVPSSSGARHGAGDAQALEGPVRVLVCDDDPLIRRLLGRALGRTPDFVVVGEVPDGRQAVDAAGRLVPDVVLLDINMPVMNGVEALPLIRDAAPDALVVVLSGHPEDVLGADAAAAGAVGYIEKGVHAADLLDRLREIVAAPRSRG